MFVSASNMFVSSFLQLGLSKVQYTKEKMFFEIVSLLCPVVKNKVEVGLELVVYILVVLI